MTQWGIFMFLVVLTIGIAALTLIVSFRILTLNYLRLPAAVPNQHPGQGKSPEHLSYRTIPRRDLLQVPWPSDGRSSKILQR